MMANISGNIRSHLNSLSITKTYDVGNPRPGLGQESDIRESLKKPMKS
jgi:hypothetical protein